MKIGMLTGGGDCPGLNAVIRAIVRRAHADQVEVIGIRNGWQGLVENDVMKLDRGSVTGILPRGGTILLVQYEVSLLPGLKFWSASPSHIGA